MQKICYQLNKNIGFLLEPVLLDDSIQDYQKNINNKKFYNKANFLINFCKYLDDILFLYEKLLFYKKNGKKYIFNYGIKKEFLYSYYLYSNKTNYSVLFFKQVGISKLKKFFIEYKQKIEKEIIFKLKYFCKFYQNNLSPKETQVASVLRIFQGKYYFEMFDTLFDNISFNFREKNVTEDFFNKNIREARKKLNKIKKLLEENPFEKKNEAFKFSFNYYTLNKKPLNYKNNIDNVSITDIKNYYVEIKNKFVNELEKNLSEIIKIKQDKFKDIINKINSYSKINYLDLSLRDAVQKLKFLRSELKNNFYKDLDKTKNPDNSTFNYFNQKHYFFNFQDKNKFREYFNLFKNKNKDKDKNKLFNEKNKKFFEYEFKNYKKLCQLYQFLSKKKGNIEAKIKGVDKELEDFVNLKYWAFIIDYNSEKYLFLVKKDKRKDFKEYLEKNKLNKNFDCVLYLSKSFTFRALEKLIFSAYNDDFFEGIKKEKEIENILNKFNVKNKFQIKEKINNEKSLVSFYQNVLQTNYVKNNLDLEDFNLKNILNRDFETIKEFKIALESECYSLKEFYFCWENLIQEWKSYISVFKITSYDLVGNQKKFKNHTKIWNSFWSFKYNYNIRLNPEGKVFYEIVDEEKKKLILDYKKNLEEAGKKFIRNRKLNEYFKVFFNFTINSRFKEIKTSFKDINIIEKSIKEYNEEFNQKNNCKDLYYFGIDLGQAELATLGIVKFNDNLNNFSLEKIKVYRIKEQYINLENIKNPSLLDDNCFEELEVNTIDLTKAKLIKNKIVLNGDIKTYLKLKELAAKRKLFSIIKIKKENIEFLQFCEDKTNYSQYYNKNFFIAKTKNSYLRIYKYDLEFENIISKEEIEKILKDYINKLQNNNLIYEEEINNLRQAIAANIVGVISYLQDLYPGILVLENLLEESRKKHFQQENFVIDSQIDWILYRKMQTKSLCPPNIKNFKSLKELTNNSQKFFQFGCMIFVPEENTSRQCPNCEKYYLNYMSKEDFEKQKFQQRSIKCPNCNTELHPDLLACINISKKGYKFLNNI